WAKKRGLPRHLGHKRALETLIDIIDACIERDIKVVSLYAFSTENWNRPKDEISHLFTYLGLFFKREIDSLIRKGGRIIISGDVNRLPKRTQKVVTDAIERTKNNNKIVINICLNYGGKQELLKATKEIATLVKEDKLDVADIDLDTIENHLYTKGLPNVDLLIRTSGEYRTSNFLPWQLAYAEFIFTDVHWPDFTPDELDKCLMEFDNRNRRFGGLKNV
ncbi:MAG: di-trans,poly-cis-decaprenylcistransferase, partial [Bacilli bacterium]|nr:di-trans,poly-cis-decaprenylcistransferase [Bacilli bacterium]